LLLDCAKAKGTTVSRIAEKTNTLFMGCLDAGKLEGSLT